VVFASAGHNAPYHLPAPQNGRRKLGFLKTGPTLPLGSQATNDRFREYRAPIAPGDLLVFFTDGLIENTNPVGKEWGYHALDQVLARAGADASAESLRDGIMRAAYAHYQEQRRQDDITLVVVKVTGA
jgi:serine phosphatase RsbU (regulator of sigma subunit)